MEPTPPDAPVTSTGAWPGTRPCASSAMTASIAVSPAVPTAIACFEESPSGSGTSQSALTRAFWAYPPQCASPTRQPVEITRSPGA